MSIGRITSSFNNMVNDSTNVIDGDTRNNFGEDDENMVSVPKDMELPGYRFDTYSVNPRQDKHLRYRTRVFAAE